MTTQALVFERVAKRFGAVAALRDISLALEAGESVLVVGRNGAGKSTLLRIAAGIARPTSGSVAVAGGKAGAARARVGYLGHCGFLHDHLTARENLVLAARLFDVADANARASLWLDRVGLRRVADRAVGGFSRGMRQRLALARALLHEPAVVLLDEPESGLDVEGRAMLAETLRGVRARHATLVVVSHRLDDALPLVDRVVVLERGSVAADRPALSWDRAAWEGAAVARSA